ncbi:MAG: hypothetical protein ABSA44_09980 [Bacteroidota bacterium]
MNLFSYQRVGSLQCRSLLVRCLIGGALVRYIAIKGVIGVGKTTLVRMLSDQLCSRM